MFFEAGAALPAGTTGGNVHLLLVIAASAIYNPLSRLNLATHTTKYMFCVCSGINDNICSYVFDIILYYRVCYTKYEWCTLNKFRFSLRV